MPKAEVISIMGTPETVTDMGGLTVELYTIIDAEPLASVGLFYEKDLVLVGSTLIFRGDFAAQSAARLTALGFQVIEKKGDYSRLAGKDDDTGRPIIVTISRLDNLTTATTFERTFYERYTNN